MRNVRTPLILLALIVASVAGMVGLLRPELFSGGDAGGAGDVRTASAQPEEPDQGIPDPSGSGSTGPSSEDGDTSDGPRLYLVLDDAGHDLDHLRAFMRFPGAFTVAVLPGLRYSADAVRMTIALGHEAILHQPMEAVGSNDPGPGAIYVRQSDAEIRRTVTSNVASMPGIIGVNNHMGSRATADQRVMGVVADALSRYRLFFLDSRTTARSVAADATRSRGIDTAVRDVFLDNVREDDAISAQLDEALAVADEQGYAVMIGHVTSFELARVLRDRYAEITAAGYRFLPLSDLLERERARLSHAGSGY